MRIPLIVAAFGAALALALFGATLTLTPDGAPRIGLRIAVQGVSVQASVAAF